MADGRQALVLSVCDVDAGILRFTNNVTSFELLDEYLETPRRPTLGVRFEENPRKVWRQAQRLPAWFSNLLPEEPLRSFLAGTFDVSPRSEFRLLEALGDDLPGALSVRAVDPDAVLAGERRSVEEGSAPQVEDTFAMRFSIAGVQPKLSVLWRDGSLVLPGRGDLGDHLVKFAPRAYPDVTLNEFWMMQFAHRAGLDVPETRLVPARELGSLPTGFEELADRDAFLIRRYDRESGGRRIHQEDFNQVLDQWPEKKYEGASYERLGLLIKSLTDDQGFWEYVRRLCFCIYIGNEDAHLKNWSLYYPGGYKPALAPAYDLVSTVQYEGLTRELALKLHDTRDYSRVSLTSFRRMARKLDLDEGELVGVVSDFLGKLRGILGSFAEEYEIPKEFLGRLDNYQRSVPLLNDQ